MNRFSTSTSTLVRAFGVLLVVPTLLAAPADRQPLFGETHVHSLFSFDASLFGNRNGPDEAYRYAKGEAITHPAGFKMQLREKLDFQAVTDHAVYLGMMPVMLGLADADHPVANHPRAVALRDAETAFERRAAFQKLFPYVRGDGGVEDDLLDMSVVRSAWQEIVEAAERHNEPGKFTTFIGYEYTPSQNRFENLHRNVIFADKGPAEPFSRLMSLNPEDLWQWMDNLRDLGMDSIAIPHNSNGSDGFMFRPLKFNGDPIDRQYTATRMRNEPVVEITQVKGTSETHPLLSPNDEFANFEIMSYQIASWYKSRPQGSYVRDAWLKGLELERKDLGNPFQFGVIGASDSHVGAAGFDEYDYWSKIGLVDANGRLRGSVKLTWTQNLYYRWARFRTWWTDLMTPADQRAGLPGANPAPGYVQTFFSEWGASGLAGVWAEENTRASIFGAMRRKEVFATSGPRITVRMFGGFGLSPALLNDPAMAQTAYALGVPMGGELRGNGRTPDFLLTSMRDPGSAPLQRLQVVKGWLDSSGKQQEMVYDVACAGGLQPDPQTHRCPDNNAKVDITDCSHSADHGAGTLKAHWRDPDFDPAQPAFYYLRVIENPTCRWSTWDAIRAESPPNPSLQTTIQERAWSSPIWYQPGTAAR